MASVAKVRFFFKICCLCVCFTDVDPKAIEAAADGFIGPVGNVEYKQLTEKLGGIRRNRVFSFFGVDPPRRGAEAVLVEAEEKKQRKAAGGAGATSALEKKKRRGKAAGASTTRCSKLLGTILGPDVLRSKGDSKDDMGEEEHREDPPPVKLRSLWLLSP